MVAGEKVQVDMENRLSPTAFSVDQQAIAFLAHAHLFGNIARLQQHAPQQRRIRLSPTAFSVDQQACARKAIAC